MKRLFNDYLAESKEALELLEGFEALTEKLFREAEEKDMDLHDLTTAMIMSVTSISAIRVLTRAVKMRTQERKGKN